LQVRSRCFLDSLFCQISNMFTWGESIWQGSANAMCYRGIVRAGPTIPLVVKHLELMYLWDGFLALPHVCGVIVWMKFIASNHHICANNDLFNLFVHQPSYFRDPNETSKIGAWGRCKILKSYSTNAKT
jgi:hypothetical protein